MDLRKDDVIKLLALQGFRIPDEDLDEVTHRLNALITRLREIEGLGFYDVEPWPVPPIVETNV